MLLFRRCCVGVVPLLFRLGAKVKTIFESSKCVVDAWLMRLTDYYFTNWFVLVNADLTFIFYL